MSYRAETLTAALRALAASRARRARVREERRRDAFTRCPELEENERRASSLMAEAAMTAFEKGGEAREALVKIRGSVAGVNAKKAELLRSLGLPEGWLDEAYDCELCRDSGFVNKKPCSCLLAICDRIQKEELSKLLNLRGQSFQTFDLSRFSSAADPQYRLSPRENMEAIRSLCLDYVRDFGTRPGNLYFHGAPGTGKTFMSSCIASAVSERGFSVVYDTAGNLFHTLESEKFGRAEGVSAPYLKCDLLILDDLGTEMVTSFTVSALYAVINTRLMERRGSIISSNLNPSELARKYTPAIASRIEGEYLNYFFFGEDQRKRNRF